MRKINPKFIITILLLNFFLFDSVSFALSPASNLVKVKSNLSPKILINKTDCSPTQQDHEAADVNGDPHKECNAPDEHKGCNHSHHDSHKECSYKTTERNSDVKNVLPHKKDACCHNSSQQFFLKKYYEIHWIFFVGVTAILGLAFGLTQVSPFFLFLMVPFVIPIIVKVKKFIEKTLKRFKMSFLKNIIRYFYENTGFLWLLVFLFFAMEILTDVFHGMHFYIPLEVRTVFNVLGWVGAVVYAIRPIYEAWKSIFKFFDRVREKHNPLRALGMTFVQGISLIIFTVLVLTKFEDVSMIIVALIAISIRLAAAIKMGAVKEQEKALDNVKKNKIPNQVLIHSVDEIELSSFCKTEEAVVEKWLKDGRDVVAFVPYGTWIPRVDGVLVGFVGDKNAHFCYVKELELNGEERSKNKKIDNILWGGTFLKAVEEDLSKDSLDLKNDDINKLKGVLLKLDKVGDDTKIGTLQDSLKRFNSHNMSRTSLFAERLGQYFILVVLTLAIIAGIVATYVYDKSLNAALQNALAVFVSLCPCSFLIGIPLTFSALRHSLATQKNVTVQNDSAFVYPRVVFLDKSNTLTLGFEVDSERPWIFEGSVLEKQQKETLFLVALAESFLKENNSYAQAIYTKILETLSVEDQTMLTNYTLNKANLGFHIERDPDNKGLLMRYLPKSFEIEAQSPLEIEAQSPLNEEKLYVGDFKSFKKYYAADLKIKATFAEVEGAIENKDNEDMTCIVMYDVSKGKFLGLIRIKNNIRDGAVAFVEKCAKVRRSWYETFINGFSRLLFRVESIPKKIFCMISSGDTIKVVKKVAHSVGVKCALAEASSQDKAVFVALFKQKKLLEGLEKALEQEEDLPLVLSYSDFRDYLIEKDLIKKEGFNVLEKMITKDLRDQKDDCLDSNVVYFVGDGANDRLAMLLAQVGVSFWGARSLESGDICFGTNDNKENLFFGLSSILKSFRKAYVVILSSIFWLAIVWNIIMLSLIFTQILPTVYAAVLHALNTFFVIVLAMSLLHSPGAFFIKQIKNIASFKEKKELAGVEGEDEDIYEKFETLDKNFLSLNVNPSSKNNMSGFLGDKVGDSA
ncbi:hypothetical protein AB834_05860 [PVC group bacterium (ex Bugula neritina AB1)]|nr:hypothetical protein AB834_05860 [PVC group bacterium (ex Bugula neritina AB1)]